MQLQRILTLALLAVSSVVAVDYRNLQSVPKPSLPARLPSFPPPPSSKKPAPPPTVKPAPSTQRPAPSTQNPAPTPTARPAPSTQRPAPSTQNPAPTPTVKPAPSQVQSAHAPVTKKRSMDDEASDDEDAANY